MSTFGEDLRRERELRNITLREISEATKINMRYLDALEQNDFEQLPGGVFNRGFVRAYAQYIGIDPETMVNAYLLEQQDRSDRNNGGLLRGPARDSGRASAAPSTERRWLLVVLIVGALAAAAALTWYWLSEDAGPRAARRPPASIAGHHG